MDRHIRNGQQRNSQQRNSLSFGTSAAVRFLRKTSQPFAQSCCLLLIIWQFKILSQNRIAALPAVVGSLCETSATDFWHTHIWPFGSFRLLFRCLLSSSLLSSLLSSLFSSVFSSIYIVSIFIVVRNFRGSRGTERFSMRWTIRSG